MLATCFNDVHYAAVCCYSSVQEQELS